MRLALATATTMLTAVAGSSCRPTEPSLTDEGVRLELLASALPDAFEFTASALALPTPDTVALFDQGLQQVVLVAVASGGERRVGGEGEGPGEFVGGSEIRLDEEGDLWVVDARLSRVTHLRRDGAVQSTTKLPGLPMRVIRVGGGMVVGLWTAGAGAIPVVGMVAEGRGDPVWFEAVGELVPELEPLIAAAEVPVLAGAPGPDGAVYLASVRGPRIHRVMPEEGGVPHSFGRAAIEPEFPSPSEADAYRGQLESLFRSVGQAVPPTMLDDMVTKFMAQPKPFFVAAAFSTDGRGRVWAPTPRGDRHSTQIDVFSPEGDFLGTTNVRDKVKDMAFQGDRLAVLVERMNGPLQGLDGVDVYRILD